jgi:hypothetical protein
MTEETLRRMIADLDGYIDRRASELAAPLIAEARKAAEDAVGKAEAEIRRQRDLIAEFRRQLAGQEKQTARAILAIPESDTAAFNQHARRWAQEVLTPAAAAGDAVLTHPAPA